MSRHHSMFEIYLIIFNLGTMKSVILFLLFSITSYSIHGQSLEKSVDFKFSTNNSIIISSGLLVIYPTLTFQSSGRRLVIYPTLTFQYERNLATGKSGGYFGISLGGGVLYDGQTRYSLIYPRAFWLVGKKSSKLELAIGGAFLMEWQDLHGAILPAIVVGYRYQKPSQRFLFRVGLALPEGIYAGIGIRF